VKKPTYTGIHGDKQAEVVVEKSPDSFTVTIGGNEYSIDIARMGAGAHLSAIVNGRSIETNLRHKTGQTYELSLLGKTYEIALADQYHSAVSAKVKAASALETSEIAAPMTGVVVSVPKNEGDAVEADEPVVIIEAMKMYDEQCSEVDGIVEKILVSVGDVVEGGQPLAIIRPD
jgi:biotin carboxyl carrier protein